MTSLERHSKIIEIINSKGYESVATLSKKLKVSSVTIRKDLDLLEANNKLFRTHGGASNTNPYTIERPVNIKENLQREEKEKIARKAATYINNNDSIMIASGTTLLTLARNINPNQKLTVVTSSLQVSMELMHKPQIEIIQLGGVVRKSASSVIGPYAERILEDVFCTTLFLGVDGIDYKYGITTSSPMEAQLNKVMLKIAQRVVVLTDYTKFGKRGFSKIGGIEMIDEIITDDKVPENIVNQFADSGIKFTIV